jgi:hypothetical protein
MRVLLIAMALLGLVSCTAEWWPAPPAPPALTAPPSRAGRLTLSNFIYDLARVETFVTPYPDCELRVGLEMARFELPLNGTRVIDTPVGADVCWRRVEPPLAEEAPPGAVRPPIPWNRAYTTSGRIVDTRL